MAWSKGCQKHRMNFAAKELNEKLLSFDSQLSDEDAKYYLYLFLRNNIAFSAELFLGIKLFPFQALAIKGMMISDYSMFVFSRGMSKCSHEDSLCWTKDGLKKMKDVEVGDLVLSRDSWNPVEAKTINQKQKTYTILTNRGFESNGLDYHRNLYLNKNLEFEWRHNKDVFEGDCLVMKKAVLPNNNSDILKFIKQSEHFNSNFVDFENVSLSDWYYFFGLLLGDGCIQDKNILISSKDEEIISFLENLCVRLKLKLSIFQEKSKAKRLQISSKPLVSFLRELGFTEKREKKKIPQRVLKAGPDEIGFLLRGLFDTDGYCSGKINSKKNSVNLRCGFTNTSKELIDQVRNLLLQLGITNRTQVCFKGGKSKFPDGEKECLKAWSILILGRDNLKIFNKKVGFTIRRKQEKLDLCEQYLSSSDFSNYIPFVGDYIKSKYKKSSFSINGQSFVCRKNTSKTKLKLLIDSQEIDEQDKIKFSQLLRDDFFFDSVKEANIGEAVTVDIQVANENCYVADGIINHNTYSTAVYILLECILSQKANIGVIAGSFRQAKMIFQKMEDILSKPEAKLAKDCGVKITKGTDMWTLTVGKGRAIALPLANGERLRGFRFNRIVLDEFITIPEKIFTEVILPFLGVIENPVEREEMHQLEDRLIQAGMMKEEDRYVWPNNKLIILSSPSFKFEYMYKLFKKYEALIFNEDASQGTEEEENELSDNAYRLIMQLSYDCAPKRLYDQNLLKQAKATMSEMQFMREFGAQFVDESDGYFRLSKMSACTIMEGDFPSVEIAGNPSDEYILSFDPNWAGNSSADHFAMHVFKIDSNAEKGCLVHSYAIAGVDLKEHMFYFHYLLTNFNIVGICGDYNGGVQFIQACNESKLFQESKIFINTMEVEFDKSEQYEADLKEFKNQYNRKERRYCILRKPSSTWIREANEILQAAIDHKRILFASRATEAHFDEQRKKNIPIEDLKWDLGIQRTSKGSMMIDFIDHQKTNIELTKSECANIEVVTNPQGSQSFQLPQSFRRQKGPNRARKDSYSALVLGNWFLKIFFDAQSIKQEKKAPNTFTPFAI